MRFVYSHSMIGAHGKCAAQFLLLQNGAPRSNDATPLLFGRAFHKFAQLYRDHCIAGQRPSDVEIVPELVNEVFRVTGLSTQHYEAMSILCQEFVTWEPIDIERSLQREAGLALDENLVRLPWRDEFEYDSDNFAHAFVSCATVGCDGEDCFHAADGEATCAREVARGLCGRSQLDPVHRLAIRMAMDEVLVDAPHLSLIIDDFKTDYFVPSQTDIEDPSGRWWKQAHEYAWGGLLYLYPLAQEVEFRFKFVRWGVTRRVTILREDIEAFGQTFLEKIRFIESQEAFPATPGPHCQMCPFLGGACPIAQKTAVYETPVEKLAARFVYSEAVREQMREELKQHAGSDGTIMVGGLPVAIFERAERVTLDVAKTLAALNAEGIENPEYLLDVSPSKLQRLLDADQFTRVIAAAKDRVESEVVFNIHQNKPELVELAKRLGIEQPEKMKVAQLAHAIAKAAA